MNTSNLPIHVMYNNEIALIAFLATDEEYVSRKTMRGSRLPHAVHNYIQTRTMKCKYISKRKPTPCK